MLICSQLYIHYYKEDVAINPTKFQIPLNLVDLWEPERGDEGALSREDAEKN